MDKNKLAYFFIGAALCCAIKIPSIIIAVASGIGTTTISFVLMCAAAVFMAYKTRRVLLFPLSALAVDVGADIVRIVRMFIFYSDAKGGTAEVPAFLTEITGKIGIDANAVADAAGELIGKYGIYALLILLVVFIVGALVNFGLLTAVSAIACAVFNRTKGKRTDKNV